MNTISFPLDEAEAICHEYQYLVNKPIEFGKDWLIDCVTVSPASYVDQWLCAYAYMDFGSAASARSFRDHTAYTVLLISVYDRDMDKLIFKDLFTYLAEQKDSNKEPCSEKEKIDGSSRIISIEKYPRQND